MINFNLSKEEEKVFKRLKNPKKIQDFLDNLPINFEEKGDTCLSPRMVLKNNKCHCIEGAFLAAAILWFNGYKPLVVDMKGRNDDWDHVITLFKNRGKWGAISKTNHLVLRYREPIYRDVRELVMSYFHEYTDDRGLGRKTLRSFSNPINLARFGKKWITSEEDLWELALSLDNSKHHKILTREQIRNLRNSDEIEIAGGELREWSPKNRRNKFSIENL